MRAAAAAGEAGGAATTAASRREALSAAPAVRGARRARLGSCRRARGRAPRASGCGDVGPRRRSQSGLRGRDHAGGIAAAEGAHAGGAAMKPRARRTGDAFRPRGASPAPSPRRRPRAAAARPRRRRGPGRDGNRAAAAAAAPPRPRGGSGGERMRRVRKLEASRASACWAEASVNGAARGRGVPARCVSAAGATCRRRCRRRRRSRGGRLHESVTGARADLARQCGAPRRPTWSFGWASPPISASGATARCETATRRRGAPVERGGARRAWSAVGGARQAARQPRRLLRRPLPPRPRPSRRGGGVRATATVGKARYRLGTIRHSRGDTWGAREALEGRWRRCGARRRRRRRRRRGRRRRRRRLARAPAAEAAAAPPPRGAARLAAVEEEIAAAAAVKHDAPTVARACGAARGAAAAAAAAKGKAEAARRAAAARRARHDGRASSGVAWPLTRLDAADAAEVEADALDEAAVQNAVDFSPKPRKPLGFVAKITFSLNPTLFWQI